MNRERWIVATVGIVLGIGLIFLLQQRVGQNRPFSYPSQTQEELHSDQDSIGQDISQLDPTIEQLTIEYLKNRDYPVSPLEITQILSPGSNYQRYVASYQSDGLTQFGLLTIPNGTPPETGWPAIIFNHGYISPDVYQTTERYVAYQDGFAREGYVTFKADYRGHASSEGEARGGYGNSDYLIDVLNATVAVQNREEVDPQKIGMWGHSMGGWITHRAMVINPDIKVGVIWAGVVGGYDDLLENWLPWWVRNNQPEPSPDPERTGRRWRTFLVEEYGTAQENPELWNSISATAYLDDLSGPIQIHHATGDSSVPYELAEIYTEKVEQAGKEIETFIYQGDDHNLSANFGVAMRRSVEFFDRLLK